ncbi:haloacid dehalogenase superfamily, subfamily IA, variant 1 with third motif having Dx(3-4)D or Dx(3-4)E [Actinomadura mexicana]|uniref:Haloacid dehalogenase superfamily, subfamily IA, variant 1 with third motif having Dx(3-4)D or Dx(3-4)E n=1 Tax=Actinomadura mexicana TaxID=134959 RepID=A0A239GVF2_9ACTN|nr:haloacid dehalogenase superfamily, subfamily IA, variant 1 with third motif having Dx(3-4)D or Dx(3-4)E [Actinomadura mexicana]
MGECRLQARLDRGSAHRPRNDGSSAQAVRLECWCGCTTYAERVIRCVVFDVGETLVDDSREWQGWADWLGVSAHTMSALVGAVTAQGRDNADALRLVRPGLDVGEERQARVAAGHAVELVEADLYPDVRPALQEHRQRGLWVGVAGNQVARVGARLRELGLPADGIATSEEWGVAKPDPGFFARLVEWAPGEPDEIVYVGDHPANDVVPARAAGLRTALVRRGPWGYLWADDFRGIADWVIDDLTELPRLLASL